MSFKRLLDFGDDSDDSTDSVEELSRDIGRLNKRQKQNYENFSEMFFSSCKSDRKATDFGNSDSNSNDDHSDESSVESYSCEQKDFDLNDEIEGDCDGHSGIDIDITNDNLASAAAKEPVRSEHLTELEGILLSLMYQYRFNASDEATQAVATEINTGAYPRKVIECTTYRTMKSRLRKLTDAFEPKIYKYFFTQCGPPGLEGKVALVECTDLNIPTQNCSDNHPECRIEDPSSKINDDDTFICYVRVRDWITHLLKIFLKKLRLPKSSKRKVGTLHDLPDSEQYQKLISLNKDPNADTLTLTVGWDGIEYTKTGTHSMWPLVANLNELSYQDRIENPMLIALYNCKVKPKTDIMLKPFIDELIELDQTPLTVTIDGVDHRFYVRLLLVIADCPARAVLLNCHTFSGSFGKLKPIFL